MKLNSGAASRRKITVTGVVQGVGFRPFIYRLAVERGISGWVGNNSAGVIIEAEASSSALDGFAADIKRLAPPQARVDAVMQEETAPLGGGDFCIIESSASGAGAAEIPADLALCADCARELAAPGDRRYRYAFTNCTNCGPRFTIVRALPYDRALTSMDGFAMCPDCRREFENPANRRFHAQPNACPVCGPQVYLLHNGEAQLRGARAVEKAAELLAAGGIIAVKSLGGFQLACDALNKKAVAALRAAKNRPHKPFAVMVDTAAEARNWCAVSPDETAELNSVRAPIVMLESRDAALCALAAPGLSRVGVMPAYTPLHRIIFSALRERGFLNPLVMTSGNLKDEPICVNDADVKARLGAVTGTILSHNRPIVNRCDDSVVFCAGGAVRQVRRARGLAPAGVALARPGPCAFGAGAELKAAFCLTRGDKAYLSQHIGDMDSRKIEEFYLESFSNFKRLFNVKPEIAAHDLHPDYITTRLAKALPCETLAVQHHAAHIFSVLAEHKLTAPAIGIAFDGTGLGTDGAVWGGEFLVLDGLNWRRAGALKNSVLPGGDVAAREIWRLGLAWLKSVYGANWRDYARLFGGVSGDALSVVDKLIDAGVNSPGTTSMGRLFDAVAFLAGVRDTVTYEAQAAMELEALCSGWPEDYYRFRVYKEKGFVTAEPASVIEAVLGETGGAAAVSSKFHRGVVEMAAEAARVISNDTGIKTAALSGGVFQNRIILERLTAALQEKGFTVYSNLQVPANDGGLALGQAWAAILKSSR